jgi:hypothetical protein
MIDENRPATMRDVEASERRIVDGLTGIIGARIEKLETNLLTAFHERARTYEVRARGLGVTLRNLDERLGIIEERVAKLERRECAQRPNTRPFRNPPATLAGRLHPLVPRQ